MDQEENNEELRSLGMDRLQKLIGESERLQKLTREPEDSVSSGQMREWVKILRETSQILEKELERRSNKGLETK
tara:strand:+ start:524 stop:745 length:222 start_codon:yes stop_codon:yes gene_type:complete